jgi:hypothetical protein
MAISVASTTQNVQKNGTTIVTVTLTDSAGVNYPYVFVAPVGYNIATFFTQLSANLTNDLAALEISNNLSQVSTIGSQAVPTFIYSTVVANVAALRVFYSTATRTQAVFIGDYLSSLTNVQLENAFGLSLAQVTTLRANFLTPAAATATTIRASVGS